MIKSVGKITLAGLLAAVVLGMPLSSKAQDTTKPAAPAASETKAKSLPFKGKLNAVDKAAMTLTVGEKNEVIHVTSTTKFYKNDNETDKPSTLEEGAVGQNVTGSYTKDGDKMTAKTVYWGGKAKAKKKAAATAPEAPAAGAAPKQ